MPRTLVVDRHCSLPQRAFSSIVAGCTHATRLLRAFMVQGLGAIAANRPSAGNWVTVDDIIVGSTGGAKQVRDCLVGCGDDLAEFLQDALKAKISLTKSVVVASSKALTEAIGGRMQLKFSLADFARNLGIDYAASKVTREICKKTSKRLSRLANANSRMRKVKKVLGGKAAGA